MLFIFLTKYGHGEDYLVSQWRNLSFGHSKQYANSMSRDFTKIPEHEEGTIKKYITRLFSN